MSSKYQEDCKKRYNEKPSVWERFYNRDGTLKHKPKSRPLFSGRKKKIFFDDIPQQVLASMPKDGWQQDERSKPFITVKGTQILIRGQRAAIEFLCFPENCDRRTYKRIWMHNNRVEKRLEILKDEYGITVDL